MNLTGDHVQVNDDEKIIDADGHLVMDDPKQHVTGDKIHVEDKDKAKVAVMTGNVVIDIKPKEKADDPKAANPPADDKNAEVKGERGRGVNITCDKVESFYKKDFIILTGNLTFKQKYTKKNGKVVERTMTASKAEYDGKTEKLHLFAPVDGKDTDEQELHFKTDVIVGTKEGNETIESEGEFRGTIFVDKDKEEGAADKPAKPADDKGKPVIPPSEKKQ